MVMEEDECGVESKQPKPSLVYLKEYLEPPIKPKVNNFKKELDKANVDKDKDLESIH